LATSTAFPSNRRQAEFFLEGYDIGAVIQIDLGKLTFPSPCERTSNDATLTVILKNR
jgi:hypothetical protein